MGVQHFLIARRNEFISGRPVRAVTLSTAMADAIKTHVVVSEIFYSFTTAVFVYVPLSFKYKAAGCNSYVTLQM